MVFVPPRHVPRIQSGGKGPDESQKAQTALKFAKKKRHVWRVRLCKRRVSLCAYLKEKLERVQRLSRRCSTVKARKSQCAAINIANASIIRVTPLASLGWRKCSSAVVFSKGNPSEGLINHANRPARVHAPRPSLRTCGSGLAALPAQTKCADVLTA